MNRRTYQIKSLLVGALLGSTLAGGVAGGVVGWQLGQAEPAQAAVPAASTAPSVSAAPANSDAVVEAARKVGPAVVTIINTLDEHAQPNPLQQAPSPFGEEQPGPTPSRKGSGSGVIISEDGYIATNNHVVEHAKTLEVIYADGSRHEARLIGADAFSDLAVIKVNDSVPAVATIGDSNALEPGQRVVAIGSPLGDYKNSVTVGVVSALNRKVGPMEGLVQTDAAINHGNSGGPLVNEQGEVIGINTLVVRGDGSFGAPAEGLGFAVSSDTLKTVSDKLIKYGEVERPFLGVQYTLLNPDSAAQLDIEQTEGALVETVEESGPAGKAGLQRGDIITAVGGQAIDEQHTLTGLIMGRSVGEQIELSVLRDGEPLTITVTLGERPSDA
jgi:2-alkenal reductase